MCIRLFVCFLFTVVLSSAEVSKLVDDFSGSDWKPSQWNKADSTTFSEANEAAPGCQGKYQRVDVRFSGKEFQWHGLTPPAPIVIPGQAKKISLWVKGGAGYPIIVGFKDGWGRIKAGDKKLEWNVKRDPAVWQQVSFDVPQDWVFPISIVGINTHNHSSQNVKKQIAFYYDDLNVTTDTSNVEEKTGLLKNWQANPDKPSEKQPVARIFNAAVVSHNLSHVFAGEKPVFNLSTQTWADTALKGQMTITVSDWNNKVTDKQELTITIDGQANTVIKPKVPLYGRYTLSVAATFQNGSQVDETVHFAYVPAVTKLSEQEQQASPYGLNVHGGRHVRPFVFVKTGIQWYRDYSFNYEWLKKSRGADNSYTGWPNHRAIVDAYNKAGVKLVACVMHFIPRPKEGQKPGSMPAPTQAYVQELKDACKAFPEISYWEVDNEYELRPAPHAYEQAVAWKHYHDYHQAFAEAVDEATGGKGVTVENGRGGIWPEHVKPAIDSGAFNKVGVINSHHYTGTDSPEKNVGNHNTSFGDAFSNHQQPELFEDHMRAVSKLADSDGIDREHWLTEFGWDDLAGPKVPAAVKAAYLPRGYMTVLASGTDKGFWFFDLSGEPAKAKQFFSGCGLLNHVQEPETAFSTMAGMTTVLPAPQYIGSVYLDGDILGHVFKNRGKLVATLFTAEPSTATQDYTFKAEAVFDWFGNKLDGSVAKLHLGPTYALGIAEDDVLYKQTAYGLDSKGYVQASAGDTFTSIVRVHNNRSVALQAELSVALPAGWTGAAFKETISLAAGETKRVSIPITISKDQKIGEQLVQVHIKEDGALLKKQSVRVFVVSPVFYDVSAITGEPGKTELLVRLLNQSVAPLNGEVKLELPASWKTPSAVLPIQDLASGAVQKLTIPIEWSTNIKSDEKAQVKFVIPGFPTQSKAIIPNHLNIPKLTGIKIDGDLSDWPATAELPEWMVGFRGIAKDARMYVGWTDAGLYLGVDVENSKCYVTNPRTFWEGDVLELFLGTSGEKNKRNYRKDDHQFWIIPLVKEDRVFLGRWKRGDSIPKTQYDIKGIEGSAKKTTKGYVMEILIKKEAMVGWDPAVGKRIGAVLSLTAVGFDSKREIFWPMSKQGGSADQPGMWGTFWLK